MRPLKKALGGILFHSNSISSNEKRGGKNDTTYCNNSRYSSSSSIPGINMIGGGSNSSSNSSSKRSSLSISPSSSSSSINFTLKINSRDQHGATPFYSICQRGKVSEVAALFSSAMALEIDVNAEALCSGCASLLIDDYRFPSKFYRTPLHVAAARGYTEIVELLLSHPNIDVNKVANGITALDAAIYNGQIKVVEMLLNDERVDVNQSNESGRSALVVACKFGIVEAVRLILQQPRLVMTPHECRTLLVFLNEVGNSPDLVNLMNAALCWSF